MKNHPIDSGCTYPERGHHNRLGEAPHDHRFVLGTGCHHLAVGCETDARHARRVRRVQRLLQLRHVDLPQLDGAAARDGRQLRVARYVEAAGRQNVGRIDEGAHRQRQLAHRFALGVVLQMRRRLLVAERVEGDFVAACRARASKSKGSGW